MKQKATSTGGGAARKDRLKSALKANLGRRKAQARARAATEPDDATKTGNNTGEQDKG